MRGCGACRLCPVDSGSLGPLIKAIEPSEVMHMLTRRVLETVDGQIRRWNDQGEPVRVSVNVSVQDLHERRFLDELAELVRQHSIQPRQLSVEITERMLISDLPRVTTGADAHTGVGTSQPGAHH